LEDQDVASVHIDGEFLNALLMPKPAIKTPV